jgi:hypothetical protein
VSSLSNGTKVYFTVEAVNLAGASPPSTEVSATPQAPPPTSTSTTSTTASTTSTTGPVAPALPVSTTTSVPATTALPKFPDANASYPNGAIVNFGAKSYVFAGGRAFAASGGDLAALEKVDHAKAQAAGQGAAPPTATAPRAGTLLTAKSVDGNPTVYVVGNGGEAYGFASPSQFKSGGFDPALVVTVPGLGGLKVSTTSAGASGLTALRTSADGAVVDSAGTFYVFAGGKAFGIPTTAALAAVRAADRAKVLSGTVTSAMTSAPVASGVLLSAAGDGKVFVTYQGDAYLLKTLSQLTRDGYGGTAAVAVPGTDRLTAYSTYSGS